MYIYKYEEIEVEGFFTNEYKGHREIIDKYAREGWRFVGTIPTEFRGHGVIERMDLVFEKKVEK